MQQSLNESPASRIASIAFLGAVCLVLAGCDGKQSATPEKGATTKAVSKSAPAKDDKHDEKGSESAHTEGRAIKLSDEELKLAGVRVEPVQEQDVSDQLVVTATIQANQDRLARLAPRVPGKIVSVSANLGDPVRAGQVLASLDSIEVGEARSAYVQAASEERVAKSNMERAERLQAEQIVSQKDFLRARAEHEKARAALRAAADKVQMLGIGINGDNVSVFPLTAPFAGTIIEKKAVLGELAQPDKPLFGIADLSVLWIEANLAEKDLARVKVGDTAFVTASAYPTERIAGKLTFIGATLDKETRTIRGRIEVRNPEGRLKPEMFVTAAIQTSRKSKAIVLPDEAVVIISAQPTVFVEDQDGFEPRAVQLGERLQGRVVITSGLKADELVVVGGAYALKARSLKSQIGEGHAH